MGANKGFKKNTYFKTWKDQQYSTTFWVIITKPGQLNDASTMLKEITGEDYEIADKSQALCFDRFNTKSGQHVIFFFQEDNSAGTVVHEAIHAKNYVFAHHGVKLDMDNDEHEAYYTDYIVREILDAYHQLDIATSKKKKMKNARKT